MSSFKTKTIALIASSLIVAVAGLSFATTPAFAQTKAGWHPLYATNKSSTAKAAAPKKPLNAVAQKKVGYWYGAKNKTTPAKAAATKNSGPAVGEKAPAKIQN